MIGDMAAGQWADPFEEEINPISGRSRSPDPIPKEKAAATTAVCCPADGADGPAADPEPIFLGGGS